VLFPLQRLAAQGLSKIIMKNLAEVAPPKRPSRLHRIHRHEQQIPWSMFLSLCHYDVVIDYEENMLVMRCRWTAINPSQGSPQQ